MIIKILIIVKQPVHRPKYAFGSQVILHPERDKDMVNYGAARNEDVGADKAELFATIVKKARIQVEHEKVSVATDCSNVFNDDFDCIDSECPGN